MRDLNTKHPLGTVAFVVALVPALACSERPARVDPAEREREKKEHALEEGKHFLADKPLKTFDTKDSKRWRLQEAYQEAERRARTFSAEHSKVLEPTSPNPTSGVEISLEKAMEGIPGDGPLKAHIETSKGTVTCRLYTEQTPDGVAHFLALARGMRHWWDGSEGRWSDQPFYRGFPVYKAERGSHFEAGCPVGQGGGEIGYRATIKPNPKQAELLETPFTLALIMDPRGPSVGGQFLVSARKPAAGKLPPYPIGDCTESHNLVQKLVHVPITADGRPLDNIVTLGVTFSR